MTDVQKFESVDDVLDHFEKTAAEINEKTRVYQHQFEEFTGHAFGKQLNALDVVRIVNKVFWSKNGSGNPGHPGSESPATGSKPIDASQGKQQRAGESAVVATLLNGVKKRKKKAGSGD
jgi:hypothetical protein